MYSTVHTYHTQTIYVAVFKISNSAGPTVSGKNFALIATKINLIA